MSDPVGYVIKRPSEDAVGKSLIFITRPSAGPFGASGTAIFAVDDIRVTETCVRVQSALGEIVFSKDLPFLLVPRSEAYPVTTAEMAKMQLDEKKEWEAVYEADEKETDALAHGLGGVTVTEDGRVKTGQYL